MDSTCNRNTADTLAAVFAAYSAAAVSASHPVPSSSDSASATNSPRADFHPSFFLPWNLGVESNHSACDLHCVCQSEVTTFHITNFRLFATTYSIANVHLRATTILH
jgi:hypothetical protein